MADYNQLKTRAQQVRDEQTIGGNTALRVGQLLMDMVDAESETVDNIVELFTGTEDNPVIPTLPNPGLLHWLQSPIVALVSMGETLDGDAGAVVQEGDLYYYNHSGYQIFVKGSGSLPGTGYKARQKVLYLNKYTGKLYEWTGADMSEIVLAGGGEVGIAYSDGITTISFGFRGESAPPVITTSETDSQVVVTATGVGTITLYDNGSQVATGAGSASYTFTKGSSSSTHTMTATAKDGDKAVSAAASLEVTVPARTYIANGLIFHLDGADAENSTWVDKIGNKSFALTDCTVNADGSVSFNGTSSKGLCSESPVVGDDWTIEVVYNNTVGTGNQFLLSWQNFRATNYGICYAFWNSQAKIINALYHESSGSDRNFACAEVDYTPGIKVHSITSDSLRNIQSGVTKGWGQSIGFRHEATSMKMQLGARYQPHNEYLDGLFAGKIYQIRVYNRALTADEISWNQAIDMNKYNFS